MIVLGIESSCDETAAAIVSDKREILGESLLSQEEHKAFGGVVPEIAARSHLEHIDEIIELCVKRAGIKLEDVDAIAASSGPGLIGGVVVGVMAAKALALALNKPFVAVNHLEGHALAARLTSDVRFWSLRTSANTNVSAPPSTMRPAKPSTRLPKCSALDIRAAR